jgi:hypothetical protein
MALVMMVVTLSVSFSGVSLLCTGPGLDAGPADQYHSHFGNSLGSVWDTSRSTSDAACSSL